MILDFQIIVTSCSCNYSFFCSDTDEDDWTIGPKPEKPVGPEPLTRDETLKKDAPMRDWDKGKPGQFPDLAQVSHWG